MVHFGTNWQRQKKPNPPALQAHSRCQRVQILVHTRANAQGTYTLTFQHAFHPPVCLSSPSGPDFHWTVQPDFGGPDAQVPRGAPGILSRGGGATVQRANDVTARHRKMNAPPKTSAHTTGPCSAASCIQGGGPGRYCGSPRSKREGRFSIFVWLILFTRVLPLPGSAFSPAAIIGCVFVEGRQRDGPCSREFGWFLSGLVFPPFLYERKSGVSCGSQSVDWILWGCLILLLGPWGVRSVRVVMQSRGASSLNSQGAENFGGNTADHASLQLSHVLPHPLRMYVIALHARAVGSTAGSRRAQRAMFLIERGQQQQR